MAIEREKILDAALDLLNDLGLDRLSTRALAAKLGVAQPALYWHFRSKGQLLDALNGEMLGRYHKHRIPKSGEAWDAFALGYARSFRKALLAVRDGARLNAGTHPSGREFADAERQLEVYVKAGFSSEEAFQISISLTRYVVGFVLEEQGEREEERAPSPEDPMREVTPYPILSEALKPLVAAGTINTVTVFEAGLRYMVEGMRLALKARGKKKAAPKGAA